MHLLLAQQGTISDGEEAIDLGQTPGDILFLSAADSELAAIAAAHRDRRTAPSLRLASLMSLKHPMSVDTYVERTARHAKLIIVRALGGASYFHYALEALHAAAARAGALIAVLPGDARPDAGLVPFSNVDLDDLNALWAYLIEGGDANARAFLDYAGAMLSGTDKPAPAVPLMKAGIWWPGRGLIGVEEWRRVVLDMSSGAGMVAEEGFESPTVAISFYRALVQSGETGPIEALVEALAALGLRPLPVFAYSLKDPISTGILESVFSALKPDVVINTTGFAVSAPGADRQPTVLEANEAIVLQAILSASSKEAWAASPQGLSARDLGMNVALPEVDGRVLARAVSFKTAARYDALVETNIVASQADAGRVRYTAELAANWARLRKTFAGDRRIALVMANYPNRDGRLGNGVGLDTPAGTVEVLRAMRSAGYPVAEIPADGDALIRHLMEGPTNSGSDGKIIRETLSLSLYNSFLESLPSKIQDEVRARWGDPEDDPYFRESVFALPFARFGEVLVGIQPARGYNIDPKESYHSPDLVPPHGYLAFYAFLRREFGAHAVIHMGKHGNLEWLPGKALALSESCYPEAILGPLPHLYPFIVNDPGEGTQAKRRSAAVIIDHLTPPLTRAESYGPLKDLEALVDEYYEASGGDPRRIRLLSRQILELVADIGLDRDAGIASGESEGEALKKLDAYLCDLKEMQIRDGLHVFGVSPEGRLLTDLTVALARVPRGLGEGGDASLQRAIAADAGLGGGVRGASSFDPLDTDMAAVWAGPRPDILADVLDAPWRTNGDTVERIELLSAKFVSGESKCPEDWKATRAVLSEIEIRLKPSILACGPAEIEGLLKGLDGRFVAPGPSGAPTRGRPDVLPTGRNFYSVDSRAVPTPAAYELGKKSAELLVRRYVQDHGEWPVSFGLTAWGTSNMRTGGDDIAQALALIGVKPLWDMSSRRVTGYEIIPPAMLGRPRVDVTLRISGFFRDAFPEQIALFDKAIRAVGALEEDEADNPIATRMRGEAARLGAVGLDEVSAKRRAGYRVFGSKPGAYGAGLQALIDEKGWERRADLAEAYLVWGSYAYGAGEEGRAERGLFEERLRSVQAVIQNQDNREHDLLDSDDYYQFEGGMAAAAEQLAGARPSIYHNDHSRPENPVIRSLEEEIGRVVRGRVVNPKWIAGVMRHGYKGAAEIAATVDYLFAFSATTGAVGAHHFEAVYQAFVADAGVRDFMIEKNPAAYNEMKERLLEAIDRSLWTPRSNSARFDLAARQQNEVNQ
ncbi:cobaltochelatase subunit CobN [Rhizobium leguminosarum]|uniref:cobaltochelatase subunit CobN n=1 Tax=Rhizobium TaxID=379 RepID=UPI0010324AFD|nr:cobaltochelatase subunit CobN [Rhizobium leguminosarum]MBA9029845.1 cobaltochelatase CobN [Rhizobium leguminosarum]NKK00461.1 cobaltochelatase subunit CobN [Rhizobium leguminosarum bv. viciae]QIO70998.1 cobaltochelatase subunit CobN [Rhizobium leguminosarum bv. trifolii]QIO78013.1 cobaltochelatase subunit CobN [Rhizobium leguminosarum bv. trifolii]TAU21194.1 cobaltochelatase subunit CobN [Rhizobium leguminosarum]